MATADKYDRQLRLWGAMGQRKLMSTKLLLLNAGPTGSEVLKNLVLPGIGKFEICDGQTVCKADLGNNFFVTEADLGRPRAQVVMEWMLEMNPDVQGTFRHHCAANVAEFESNYVEQFNMVIATQLPEPALSALAATCQKHAIPLLIVHSFGLIGHVRLQVPNHTIVDSKPDAALLDLRIAEPFPALQNFANEFNLETMNSHEHGHVPYVVILLQCINEWKAAHNGELPKNFAAKEEFKKLVQSKSRGSFGHEVNFTEAGANAYKAYSLAKDSLPSEVSDVLAYASPLQLSAATPNFWFLARALAGFVAKHNCLPHSGHVPDMTAFSTSYVKLQKIYMEKAKEDAQEIYESVKKLIAEFDSKRTLAFEEVVGFCKHASCIGMLNTRSLAEEFQSVNLQEVDMEDEDSVQSPLIWYFMIRAVHCYIAKFAQYPGVHEGDEYTEDAKWLIERAKSIAQSASSPFPEEWITLNHGLEMCRYAEAEVHNIAAILGGIASQEAVKKKAMDDDTKKPSPATTYPYSFNPFIFPRSTSLPVGADLPNFYPISLSDTCAVKTITSGAMGWVLGRAMGLLLSSYEAITPPIPVPGQRELPKVPWREQLQISRRMISEKSTSWGRNFLFFSAMISGMECLVDKKRAHHDISSVAIAGCATGAVFAAGQGVQAQCLACGGMAAFSAAMEMFMHGSD
ncbi:SUMO-activating enzyme (SAE) [Thraustotheca clavata]|uniref:NEDD8-activating enzyme E1 regulatory subunit n=1 Tax=Thraustotheca clavata TaxID=74557 RepID=A0A1V9Z2P7_9STRA|nr:SUMO-activating enzyme (SAE) [Thraustotheca clavata]